jgi:hypothetical protein
MYAGSNQAGASPGPTNGETEPLSTIQCYMTLATRCGNAMARPNPLPGVCQAGRKARRWACRATDKKSVVAEQAKKNSSKLPKRCWNIYENKGPLWKTPQGSWNVYENKDT